MTERRLISKSEYARLRGVTPAAVTYWARDGKIVIEDGKVDVDASNEKLKGSNHPIHGGKRTAGETMEDAPQEPLEFVGGTLTEARTSQARSRAKLDTLEYEERVGKLIERTRSEKAIADGLAPIVSRLQGIAARVSPKIVGQTDIRRVMDTIDDEVIVICQEIADTLRAMAASSGATKQ